MLGDIQHQGLAHGLAALRGAAAARQDGDFLVGRDLNGADDVLLAPRHHNADGFNLIDRGVGGISPARGTIEQHFTLQLPPQTGGQRRVANAAGTRVSRAGIGRALMRRHVYDDLPRARSRRTNF